MSCQGKPIDLRDVGRTSEQEEMMKKLGPLIWGMMGKGATPFSGQLTQGPDPGMLQAMNMMSMVGGQGPYQYPGMQTGAYPSPPGMNVPPWGGGGGGGGGGGDDDVGGGGDYTGAPYDPYAPGRRLPPRLPGRGRGGGYNRPF